MIIPRVGTQPWNSHAWVLEGLHFTFTFGEMISSFTTTTVFSQRVINHCILPHPKFGKRALIQLEHDKGEGE